MRSLFAKLPWGMGLLWAGVLAGLLWWLPPSSQWFAIVGLHVIAGSSADGQYIVLSKTNRPDQTRWATELTGRFLIVDLTKGTMTEVKSQPSFESAPNEWIRHAMVIGGNLWIDHRRRDTDHGRVSTMELETLMESEGEWSGSVDGLNSMRFSRDGRRMSTLSATGKLSLWSVESQTLLCSIDDAGTARAMSTDGRFVGTYSRIPATPHFPTMHRLRVYDATTGALLRERKDADHEDAGDEDVPLSRLDFTEDDRALLLEGLGDRRIRAIRSSTVRTKGRPSRKPKSMIWRWETDHVSEAKPTALTSGDLEELLGSRREVLLPASRGERWTLVTNNEPTARDRFVRPLLAWFPKWNLPLDAGRSEVWDNDTRRLILTLPQEYSELRLSYRTAQVAALRENGLEVWRLPPARPWGRALLGSLVVPLAWGLGRWRKAHCEQPHR